MAISIQIRPKVLAALGRGASMAPIARRFEISERTVSRLKGRQQAGLPVTPSKTGPQGHTKLTDADIQLIREQVEADPGITLRELQGMLSVQVAESTVCRALQKRGLSFKKSR